MSLTKYACFFVGGFALIGFCGCTGDVETTDDSVRMEAEVPKVETGDEDVDLNPETDDDIDIDTPLEGDS